MPKKLLSANTPEGSAGLQYHIQCRPGDVARYVLLPGDPGRVPLISAGWSRHREIANHREYVTHTGSIGRVRISCTSTGIGGPAAAIAVEELLRVGADTFIRVGSTGALRKGVQVGDVVISAGSVRLDGTSAQYVWRGYPALANYEVMQALIESAERLGKRYHVGITASTDSFYPGQGRPGFKGYATHASSHIIEDARAAGIVNFEMESSTIFTLSGLYGARAGAVCAVLANRESNQFVAGAGISDAIEVANGAIPILASWDAIKAKERKRYFYPSLLKH
ncbi:MAG TPA: uridine phosphorylase [Conexivisphaerales archaeon]|nr:uridine phosphorylase [Conexivisphaerales archaeon]